MFNFLLTLIFFFSVFFSAHHKVYACWDNAADACKEQTCPSGQHCVAVQCGAGSYAGYDWSCVDDGGCFLAGTKIRTPDGEKNIEDIKVGDVVLSYEPPKSKFKEITPDMLKDLQAKGFLKKSWKMRVSDFFVQAKILGINVLTTPKYIHNRLFVE